MSVGLRGLLMDASASPPPPYMYLLTPTLPLPAVNDTITCGCRRREAGTSTIAGLGLVAIWPRGEEAREKAAFPLALLLLFVALVVVVLVIAVAVAAESETEFVGGPRFAEVRPGPDPPLPGENEEAATAPAGEGEIHAEIIGFPLPSGARMSIAFGNSAVADTLLAAPPAADTDADDATRPPARWIGSTHE